MSESSRNRSCPRVEEFTVGWICALPIEQTAAIRMLDETYTTEYYTSHSWTLGRVGEHNIVIACLPSGQIETNSAAVTATEVRLAFPSIHIGLLVGIGGGVPSDEIDIRLGDVAVSQPQLKYSGVI